MRTVLIGSLLLILGWSSAALAQPQPQPDSLLPPARVERANPLPPWSAALVPTLLTTGAVLGSAGISNNEVGFWLAAVSVWWLPSMGNVLLGNYAEGGRWWALRTLGMLMMLPATIEYRSGGGFHSPASGRIIAYFFFGALVAVGGFVADIISAHHYATRLKNGDVIFRQAAFTPYATPKQTGFSFAFVF